nr:hypothetical protein [Sphingomonas sp. Y57]
MRKAVLGLSVPLLLLGACEMKVGKDEGAKDGASVEISADGNVAIAAKDGVEGVSVSVPGFEGKLKIPGMELGGDHMDIDGMKLYPGSKLSGINVTDQNGEAEGDGIVEMRFTSPADPAKVAAYYAAAAPRADFRDVTVKQAGAGSVMTATKGDGDHLTITINPAPGGSAGTILIRGTDAR